MVAVVLEGVVTAEVAAAPALLAAEAEEEEEEEKGEEETRRAGVVSRRGVESAAARGLAHPPKLLLNLRMERPSLGMVMVGHTTALEN